MLLPRQTDDSLYQCPFIGQSERPANPPRHATLREEGQAHGIGSSHQYLPSAETAFTIVVIILWQISSGDSMRERKERVGPQELLFTDRNHEPWKSEETRRFSESVFLLARKFQRAHAEAGT